MGTRGVGEDRVSDELRAQIVNEHGLNRVTPAGFETDAGRCGRSGAVALFTVWGTAPAAARDAVVSTFEGAAADVDADVDADAGADVDADVDADAGADVDSWRGVFASSVRVLGVWKAGFGGGDDDAGQAAWPTSSSTPRWPAARPTHGR